ncbi:MAG: aminotransferase class I/II-fold pyridoxal phosphate-dependent enzyme [Clostridia bacterium]|nr:aminotransferase class I/II-fold pyridoxal phosphate-dependent enzyme [Clostridia bacterium]
MVKLRLKNRNVKKRCHIYAMLRAQGKHLSFHTPGHKQPGYDVTELSYTDNLSAPTGCIAKAQADIAEVLGAKQSFILTDGSTSGVLAMLHAYVLAGYQSLAIPDFAHKSVKNGCKLCHIAPVFYTAEDLSAPQTVLEKADGLLIVSPDYYGRIPNLQQLENACKNANKPLLCDGAHGGHLKGNAKLYAGFFADMWVDGVHKSLPALTQGAVVSAKTEFWAEYLRESVDIFRTSSPSYPVMASVEYAVKYPPNPRLEDAVFAVAKTNDRVIVNDDWTKFLFKGGKRAYEIKQALERRGIFAEFCDGDLLLFYLSPATTNGQFSALCRALKKVGKQYPYERIERIPAPEFVAVDGDMENIPLAQALGRVCAKDCGLFPPCVTLIARGERITQEKIRVLQNADGTFGLTDGKITVCKADAEE